MDSIKEQINKTFQNFLLDEDVFKRRLTSHSELNKAVYITCNAIVCRKTNLLRHSRTIEYIYIYINLIYLCISNIYLFILKINIKIHLNIIIKYNNQV